VQSAPILDVSSRIQITMTNQTTHGTLELSLTEGHIHDMSTVVAGSACVSWVHSDDFSTACYCLVGEHLGEPRPRSIVNVLTETMITNHPLDVQVLDTNSLVSPSEGAGEFVEEVAPLVFYPLMQSGNFETSLLPVVATFDLATETSLQSHQTMFTLEKIAGICYDRAIGQRGIVLQPNIHADLPPSMLDLRNLNLAGEHSKPLTGMISLDGQSLNSSLGRTVQHNRDVPDFGAVEPLVVGELETTLRIGDAMHLTLEAGKPLLFSILLTPTIKVFECLVHTVGHILENLREHFRMLPTQILVETKLADTLLRRLVCVDIQLKKLIIDFLTDIECRIQSFLLFPTRIQPVLIHSQLHENILEQTNLNTQWAGFHPTSKERRVFPPAT